MTQIQPSAQLTTLKANHFEKWIPYYNYFRIDSEFKYIFLIFSDSGEAVSILFSALNT